MYQKKLRYVVIQFELTMMDELMKQQMNGHVSEIKIHINISTRFSSIGIKRSHESYYR